MNAAKSADSSWFPPPGTLNLKNNEVHVWRSSLMLTKPCIQGLLEILSPEERKRAERFCFQRDRENYIVARGCLRTILGRYIGIEPSLLEFCYNPYGKPSLTKAFGGETLRFNLSHSHDIALYAIAYNHEVGVDIERVQLDFPHDEIAKRFFSPREVAALLALPANMQQEAFFDYWTCKEAFIKARGEGLTLSLDRFDISLVPGELVALLNIIGDPQEASRWSLQRLLPGPGHAAALAVEGHDWQLKCWQWLE